MAIAFVGGDAANGNISAALNSATANFAVIHAGSFITNPTTITEGGGYSNTWNALTLINTASHIARVFWAELLSKGPGHTFQHNGSSPGICVGLFSGVITSVGVVDFIQAANAAPGTVTPTANGALIISGFMQGAGTATGVSGGLTIIDTIIPSSGNVSSNMAYLIQAVAAPIAPAWSGAGGSHATNTVVFSGGLAIPDVRETQQAIELASVISVETRESQNVVEVAAPQLIPVRETQQAVEVVQDISVEVRQAQNIIEIISPPLDLSGIYFINVDKTHDTYYQNTEVQIPNPTVRLALMGE